MFFIMFCAGIVQHDDSKFVPTLSSGILFVALVGLASGYCTEAWCCMLTVGAAVAGESLVEEEEEEECKHCYMPERKCICFDPCEGGCGENLKDCKCGK